MKNKRRWSLLVVGVLVLGYCLIESSGAGDLFIYLKAAEALRAGGDIYTLKFVDGYHYYYSVLFALLLQPFTAFPYHVVKFFWLLLNTAMALHMAWMLWHSRAFQALGSGKRIVMAITLLYALRTFQQNIHTSQITILIMWLTVCGVTYMVRGQIWVGALLLALGINIKLLPVLVLCWLAYRGMFRQFLACVICCVILWLLPSLFIGLKYNLFLIKTWWALSNPSNAQHVLDVEERSFHGLSTLLATLLVKDVPDAFALPLRRHILDLPISWLPWILNGIRIFLLALSVFVWRWPPFKTERDENYAPECAWILLLIPLLFPHQQHYAFLFAVPAFAFVVYTYYLKRHKLSTWNRWLIAASLVLVYLSANLKILVGEFEPYYEHFKILTYGTLILIPLMIWAAGQFRSRGGCVSA